MTCHYIDFGVNYYDTITPSNYLYAKWNMALDGSIRDEYKQSVTSCLLFTGHTTLYNASAAHVNIIIWNL